MSDDKTVTPEAPITMKQVVDLIPTLVAAAVTAGRTAAAPAAPARAAHVAPRMCSSCGQQLSGCEGKHVLMVVHPQRYPQHARFFPGAIINGVRYLSNDEGHKVLVPENCKSSILGLVHGYEENEQAMAVGRKAERLSGTVSPNGTRFTAATQGWR
jgi:hypothetical protein